MSWRATSCWNFSKLSVSSLTWNKIRKGSPSSVSSWKRRTDETERSKKGSSPQNRFQAGVTNLSILKGDLSDQRHTLVLSPGVGQVKVGERAEVDHVRNVLPQRLIDHVVSPDTLGLRYGPVKKKNKSTLGITKWPPKGGRSRTYGLHLNAFLGRDLKTGGSPKGSQECAVISKDVGNLFIRVVVIGVLVVKVTDDISLTPLLDKEWRVEAILFDNSRQQSTGRLHPQRSSLPWRVAPSRGQPAAGGWSRRWLPLTSDPCTPASSSSHCETTSVSGTYWCGTAGLCPLRGEVK